MKRQHGMIARAGQRRRVTQVPDDVLRTLWADETLSIAAIGRKLNASQYDLGKQARELGLPPRVKRHHGTMPDPTEQEIAEMCEEIQRTRWDERMKVERCAGNGPVAWEIPVFSMRGDR